MVRIVVCVGRQLLSSFRTVSLAATPAGTLPLGTRKKETRELCLLEPPAPSLLGRPLSGTRIDTHVHLSLPSHPRNMQKALYALCAKHLAVLVDKAELASSNVCSDTDARLAAQAEEAQSFLAGCKGHLGPLEPSSPSASQNESGDELRGDLSNQPEEERSPGRKGKLSFSSDSHRKSPERGGDGGGVRGGKTRHDRREKPAFRRQFSSFESNGTLSGVSAMSGPSVPESEGARAGIGTFLLREEEQVRREHRALAGETPLASSRPDQR